MLLAGHKVLELAVTAQIRGHKVGVSRVWVSADVEVEGQVGDLTGIFRARVAHFVSKGQIRGVGRVNGSGRPPGFFVGEGFTIGDSVFFVFFS